MKRVRQARLSALCSRVDRSQGLSVALLLWLFSRVWFSSQGGHFDAADADSFMHLADPLWLRDEPLATLLELHSQPPMLNAIFAVCIQLGGLEHWPVFFEAIMRVLSAAGLLALFSLCVRRGMHALAAGLWAGAIFASPTVLLYEARPFYTMPVAVLFLWALVALDWLRLQPNANIDRGHAPQVWPWLLFCASLLFIALTRSMFHLIWLVLSLGLAGASVIWLRDSRPDRASIRRTLRVAAPFATASLLLLGTVYANNAIRSGHAGVFSWSGMVLHRITVRSLPEDERAELIAAGVLSDASRLHPFASIEERQALAANPTNSATATGRNATSITNPANDRPAIQRELRKASGAINFHHPAYVEISRALRADAVAAIWARPANYLGQAFSGAALYFAPGDWWHPLKTNRDHISGYATAMNRLSGAGLYGTNWLAVGAYVCLTALLLRSPRDPLLLFCALNCLWIFALSTLCDYGENNRMRVQGSLMLAAILGPELSRLPAWLLTKSTQPGTGEKSL